jgi:hypothetical protein
VLREGSAGGVLRIEVSAVPRTEKLRGELLKWGLLYDRSRRPRIGVSLFEGRRSPTGAPGVFSAKWTGRLVERLRGLGFPGSEVAPQARRVDSSGMETHDVVVSGSASVYGNQAVSVDLSAARGNPLTEIAKIQGSFPLDEGPAVAAGLIASALLENLLPAWFRVNGDSREYAVRISGLKSYKQYLEISGVVNSGRDGFASGMERTYAPNEVTFTLAYGGSVTDLVQALGRIRLTEGSVAVTEVSGSTVSATIR